MTKAGNSQIMRTITLLITIFSLSLSAHAKYSGGTGDPNESATVTDVAKVVGQVSKESYTNYLQNDLYTHDGDDRSFGGPEHDLAQQRIRELFESFGLETSLHPFENGDNVVGVHRGISCPNEIYVLGAHYDSVEGSPGAMDNGSGVAGLLESARVLSQHAFEGTIVFIAFDREEPHLLGSAAYAKDHIGDRIHGMLNLDAIAHQACGPEHPDYNKIRLTWYGGPPEPTRLLDDLTTGVESYTELTCVVVPYSLFFSDYVSDHRSFAIAGFAAVGFEPYACPTKVLVHTSLDSVDQPDWIDYDQGTCVTQAVVAGLATLAILAPARIYPDFDGDGDVDIEDRILLTEHWGGSDSQFDIAPPPNGDGVVNDQDLSALLHYMFSDGCVGFPAQAQYSGGTGEPNDPYSIATAEDLMLLGESLRDYTKHFILRADIDLDPNLQGREVFSRAVIPVFDGVFDGNGHTISNLTIRGGDSLGLFGRTDYGAIISNLALEAVDVNGTGECVGGLVGFNGGSITSCCSTGSVSGIDSVGGLVGRNFCSITSSYSTSSVTGDSAVGGLVGYNSYGSITTSYSTGSVIGNESVGGLVGEKYSGSITRSIWDNETSGQTTTAGGVGLTTTEMMDPYTLGLNGFANDPNWLLDAGRDYPRLAWEGTSGQIIPEPVIDWLDGQGTEEEPYRIDTVDQLIFLRRAGGLWDKHFILGADIDLDPNLQGREVFSQAVIQSFDGVFDGNHHTISHLTISGDSYLGLFGQLGSGAIISNLALEAVNVNGTGECVGGLVGRSGGSITSSDSSGSVSGYYRVGGLVGDNEGSITSCYSTGTVSGRSDDGGLVGYNRGSITSSYSTGTVSGDYRVGGLVGCNRGSITTSYSTGAVIGDENVGGSVGWNYDSVIGCYSTGVVDGNDCVGGLVGWNGGGSVTQCYSTGAVNGRYDVGGLVGENKGSITTSYSTGMVSGHRSVGGLVGYNNGSITMSLWDMETSGLTVSDGGVGLTTTEMMNPYMLGLNGFANDPNWILDAGHDYPRLAWEGTAGQVIPEPVIDWLDGQGTEQEPYRIDTVDQLIFLRRTGGLWDKHFILGADIDLDPNLQDREVFSQAVIQSFDGVFDGNDHTISHLTISGDSHLGLFGQLGPGAIISNLALEAVNVNGTGDCIGGLVGLNNEGSVTSSYSTGSVTGDRLVGGLVGDNERDGSIVTSYSHGSVTGGHDVGGLVGENDGSITSSYSTSSVTGNVWVGGLVGWNRNRGSITSSYSTGTVSGAEDDRVGGLVGSNGGDIASSFWDIQTSGQATSNGGTGKITAEMQTESTFTDAGWDFMDEMANGTDGIWWIYEGDDYPRLWWEAE